MGERNDEAETSPETWDFTEFLEHVTGPPPPTNGKRASSVPDMPEDQSATPDEVLDAIENGPRGDLGRHYASAEPVVDTALANLMAMVRRERDEGGAT